MRMYDIIEKKREGFELTQEEIQFFVNGYTHHEIPDYQVSALLMAIYFQGMAKEERALLTMAMVKSGDEIDLSAIAGTKVDKHSTGGVGDTTTLILAPLVASLGIPVAKMSGRGLGHTGGTLDKLESIPGFHVEIDNDEFVRLVNRNKLAVIGQSGNLTPADQKIYSLRDVTATVNSIPLIASSIMSKKIASGADAIVLDVKTGSGAFMKEIKEAEELARAMVHIGNRVGRQTMAVISDMSQPLGRAIGNALEVQEAIDTLNGHGPKDLTELCLALGSQMAVLGGKATTIEEAKEKLKGNLANGEAIECLKLMVKAQGGNEHVIDQPGLLPQSPHTMSLPARSSGYVVQIIADDIGLAASMLGAGRTTKDANIDLSVGVVLHKKIGDQVSKGEPLATIHANNQAIEAVQEKIYQSIHISSEPIATPMLIYETITE